MPTYQVTVRADLVPALQQMATDNAATLEETASLLLRIKLTEVQRAAMQRRVQRIVQIAQVGGTETLAAIEVTAEAEHRKRAQQDRDEAGDTSPPIRAQG